MLGPKVNFKYSKLPAKRLGFKFEEVFRQMFIFKGRSRDSA